MITRLIVIIIMTLRQMGSVGWLKKKKRDCRINSARSLANGKYHNDFFIKFGIISALASSAFLQISAVLGFPVFCG